MININLVGVYRVNYTFMPMIEKCKGRIINFSSEYGTYTTVPFKGLYTITKHAVESYSDGLRRELKYIGIPVSTIRPGAFKTNMQKSTYGIFEQIKQDTTHYLDVYNKLSPLLDEGAKKSKVPQQYK